MKAKKSAPKVTKKSIGIVKPARVKAAKPKPVTKKQGAEQGASIAVLTDDSRVSMAIASALKGTACVRTAEALESKVVTGAHTVFVDVRSNTTNAYELVRRLRVRSRARFAVLHPAGPKADQATQAIARFAGAEAVLSLPVKPAEVKHFVKSHTRSLSPDQLLEPKESRASQNDTFRNRVLSQISQPNNPALLTAISDPETRLYSSTYGAFALDMELKRAQRFGLPLTIAVVGFEGEAKSETLLELAGTFLNEIRDTDTLARFDVNSFLFLMPNTLVEGASAMLERIAASVRKQGLTDIVGDVLALSGGVAGADLSGAESRESLFSRAHDAFDKALNTSRAAVVG